jgi:hypothetical protein
VDNAFTVLVIIGVVFFRVILPVLKWFKEQAEKQEIGGDQAEQLRILQQTIQALATGGELPSAGGREQFEAAQRRVRALIKQGELQLSRLPTGAGATSVIADTLIEPTLSDLERADRQLQASLDLLGNADSAAASAFLRNDNTVRVAREAAELGESRLKLLAEAAVARHDRMAEVMADADAFAAALVQPLRDFASAHGMPLPPNEPISLPTEPGSEAVMRGLFANHPVIFVPRDFGEHIFRWAAVAHEVGHLVWHAEPTLRREMMRIQPSSERPWLPRAMNGRLVFNIDAAFNGWLEELVCDAFAVILLGPAGFRGLVHALDDTREPLAAMFAAPDNSGQLLDEHPPPHLRVHLAAWLLNELGYDVEMKPLLAQWQKSHEDADYLVLPVQGSRQTVAVDLQGFVDKGTYILSEMMSEEFRGLAGYPLSAVSGQEIGPGVWARVKRRAEDILKGDQFHDNPRVAIAAGIEAAAKSPASVKKIAAAVRATIVGRGQRMSADANYKGHVHGEKKNTHPLAVAQDAILLWEILKRPASFRPPPGPKHR